MEFQNKRILIVDDDHDNRELLTSWLEDDFEVTELPSGNEALEVIENLDPAVVLLDVTMVGLNGFEVTRKIKTMSKVQNAKVVLLTGREAIEEKLEGYEAGADDYVTKPFSLAELGAKVNVFVRLFNLEKQLLSQNEQLEKEVEHRAIEALKQNKMANIGRSTAEIVHNLKNPLAALHASIYFLKKVVSDEKHLSKMEGYINQIKEISNTVLDSARLNGETQGELEEVDLNELLKKEVQTIRLDEMSAGKITYTENYNEIPRIKAQKIHIVQVFSNLLSNAKDAVFQSNEKHIQVETSVRDGNIEIKIKDSGSGIPDEIAQKVFEPFFSTKTKDDSGPNGSGLGLGFSRRIIELYGGSISFLSGSDQGTAFLIQFPL
ncbi:MAG: response regulator [Bacteriovoracaceae bacterium]